MSGARTGSFALVEYNVSGPVLLHERFLGAKVAGATWIIVTPDEDIYAEILDPAESDEVRAVRFKPSMNVMPVGLASGTGVYAFDPRPTAARRRQWMREAEVLAVSERRRQGLGALPPEDVAPLAAELGGPPILPDGRGPSAAPAPAVLRGEGSGRGPREAIRRTADPQEELPFADPEEGGIDALRDALEGRRADGAARGDFGATHETGDARTLPVRYDTSGVPSRGFKEAVELCSQSEIPGFLVRGPRTARWVLNFLAEQGSPLQRHTRFKTDAKLSSSDPGMAQHEQLCKLLQTGACFDQYDMTNSAMVELICRELQMIEERYSSRLHGASELSEEAHLFLGTHSSRGNVCMDPALRDWIAGQLRDDASIAKERRKAREERQMQRAPHGEGGGKKGPGK